MRREKSTYSIFVSDVKSRAGQQKDEFKVRWKINPHMKIGASKIEIAESEHQKFTRSLQACGADVKAVPYIPGAYDSVFLKDAAVVLKKESGNVALLTRPLTKERRREPVYRADAFEKHGVRIVGQSKNFLEGGDLIICEKKQIAFLGFGFRTALGASTELEQFLNLPVVSLELKDPYFYHLDTALNLTIVGDSCIAFAYPEAFTPESWQLLCGHPSIDKIIPVSRREALRFALNWVEVNDTVILGSFVPQTIGQLELLGKKTLVRNLSQFLLAGGSAACLTVMAHEHHH